jgi:hypothetical protein
VLVPKATVNEDRCPLAWEHDVGLAGEVGTMESESVARPRRTFVSGVVSFDFTARITALRFAASNTSITS